MLIMPGIRDWRSCALRRAPQSPARAQADRQLPAQGAATLDIDRLIDRLVRDLHLWIVGEFLAQFDRHLLGAELLPQFGLDEFAQLQSRGELGRLGSRGPAFGSVLRPAG
jgi:hypothetical protein